jgi:ketosteroid isomerase-like protein
MLNETTLTDFFAAMSRQDLDALGTRLHPAARFEFPKTQPLEGRETILRFFRILFRRYPELVFTVRQTVVEGRLAAIHWTNAGHARDGVPYANEGVTLLETDGDFITWLSDFFKDTGKF